MANEELVWTEERDNQSHCKHGTNNRLKDDPRPNQLATSFDDSFFDKTNIIEINRVRVVSELLRTYC